MVSNLRGRNNMTSKMTLNKVSLKTWEKSYDAALDAKACNSRGEFLEAFPLKNLSQLQMDEYVIGLQSPTFCTFVEAKTRLWANIQGATSEKFGIYFGKIKSDPTKKYRFTQKFGQDQESAFQAVKKALLELVRLGGASSLDFKAIDENPLSQMFKAKILSLYFPEKFLNVCSREHLEMLGEEMGFGEARWVSEYQHLLFNAKLTSPVARNWNNPKFTAFLYQQYGLEKQKPKSSIQKPRKMSHRKINFEDISEQRAVIGKAAEEFALEWEKKRLIGENFEHLTLKIDDRRDRPKYGYDFLSHTSPGQQRFIEVKAVGKLYGGEGYRFFLSDNEHKVSLSDEHRKSYYFYLVYFDQQGKPVELEPIHADQLYRLGEMLPASYAVRFHRLI